MAPLWPHVWPHVYPAQPARLCGFRFCRPTCFINDKPQGAPRRAPARFARVRVASRPTARTFPPHVGEGLGRARAVSRDGIPAGYGRGSGFARAGRGSVGQLGRERDAPSSRSRLRRIPARLILSPEPGLLTDQRPEREAPRLEGVAVGADQITVRAQLPAVPRRIERAQIAQPQQAQELDRRPRHPVAPAVPVPHRAHAHAEEGRAGFPAQQAAMAQLAEAFRADVPDAAAWTASASARAASRASSSGSRRLIGGLGNFA